jgi:hypothetical protein
MGRRPLRFSFEKSNMPVETNGNSVESPSNFSGQFLLAVPSPS